MMKRISTAVFCMLGLCMLAFTQTLRSPLSAPYTRFGAYSSGHSDVFSYTANTGSLAQLKEAAAGFYGGRRFLLSEFNRFSAVAAWPTPSGNFGMQAHYDGFTGYNETQMGLAYARSLGKKLDAGIQFNYNGIQIAWGYGSATAWSAEAGILLHITERLHAGIHILHPAGKRFGKSDELLESQYSLGIGYEASEKFFTSMEITKEEGRPVNVETGMQYKFAPKLMVRAGLSSFTSSTWFGVGFIFGSLRTDIITSYHRRIGFSPGMLLLFQFSRKNK